MLPTVCLVGISLTLAAVPSAASLPAVGTEVRRFEAGHSIKTFLIFGHALTASHNGSRFLVVGREQATVWTPAGERVESLTFEQGSEFTPAGFTADGRQVFGISLEFVYARWDAATRRWRTQMTAEQEIHQQFTVWLVRRFRPIRLPGETDLDFNYREQSFGMAVGFLTQVLWPWISYPVAVTPDGKRQLVATSGTGSVLGPPNVFLVQVWDTEQNRAVKVFLPPAWPRDLYAGCQVFEKVEKVGRSLVQWAASECPLVAPRKPQPVDSDENRIGDLGAGGDRWFDRATRTLARLGYRPSLVAQLIVNGLRYHEALAAPNAISADGGYFASCWGDPSVQVWDLTTGEQVRRLRCGWANAIAFDPTGKTIVTAGRGEDDKFCTLTRWDVRTGRRLWAVPARHDEVGAVRLSADGKLAIVMGRFRGVSVWDAEAGKPLGQLGDAVPVFGSCGGCPDWSGVPVAATFLGSTGRVATITEGGMMQIWQLP